MQTDRQTDPPTNRQTGRVRGKWHFQLASALFKVTSSTMAERDVAIIHSNAWPDKTPPHDTKIMLELTLAAQALLVQGVPQSLHDNKFK